MKKIQPLDQPFLARFSRENKEWLAREAKAYGYTSINKYLNSFIEEVRNPPADASQPPKPARNNRKAG